MASVLKDTLSAHGTFSPAQARAFTPMKALTLVLKAYLKVQRLNDVATGGLSSYSLCNMVIAHLQEELKVREAAEGRGTGMEKMWQTRSLEYLEMG